MNDCDFKNCFRVLSGRILVAFYDFLRQLAKYFMFRLFSNMQNSIEIHTQNRKKSLDFWLMVFSCYSS